MTDEDGIYESAHHWTQQSPVTPQSASSNVSSPHRLDSVHMRGPFSPVHAETTPLVLSSSPPVGMRPAGAFSPASPSSSRIPAELLDAIDDATAKIEGDELRDAVQGSSPQEPPDAVLSRVRRVSGPAASPVFGAFPRFRTDSYASRTSASALRDSVRSGDMSRESFEHTLPRDDRTFTARSLRDSSGSNGYARWSGERPSEHVAALVSPSHVGFGGVVHVESAEHHPHPTHSGPSRPSPQNAEAPVS